MISRFATKATIDWKRSLHVDYQVHFDIYLNEVQEIVLTEMEILR